MENSKGSYDGIELNNLSHGDLFSELLKIWIAIMNKVEWRMIENVHSVIKETEMAYFMT